MTKICLKCEVEKPLEDFSKLKAGKYGVRNICKKCSSGIARDTYRAYKEAFGKPVIVRNKVVAPDGMKHCYHCKKILPTSEFYVIRKPRSNKKNLQTYCKKCCCIKFKERYRKNRGISIDL